MQNSSKQTSKASSLSAVSEQDFVPQLTDVVSPAIIADVFENQPIPFAVNSDGSVSKSVYDNWLSDLGAEALRALANESEIVYPQDVEISNYPFHSQLPV